MRRLQPIVPLTEGELGEVLGPPWRPFPLENAAVGTDKQGMRLRPFTPNRQGTEQLALAAAFSLALLAWGLREIKHAL
jgi:hypothetical protein